MTTFHNLLQHNDIQFSTTTQHSSIINPATQEAIAYVKNITPDQLSHLITQSQIAQRQWQALTALQRADFLWQWYHLILKNKSDLAKILTMEQGKSLTESLAEIDYAASFIRWFAEQARRIDGDILTSTKSTQKLMVVKQAIGVTAAITPWNFPAAMITRKAAPALASGCTMIVKPAPQTPLTAYALANLAYQAGIPKDVLTIINGDAQELGQVIFESPIIRKISFTGSTQVGQYIYQQSAKHIKKLSLELGGNAPFIVFNDANLDKAIDAALISKFRNSGQTCICSNRIYVQAEVYDQFCEKFTEKVANLKLGNGLDPDTTQGPLIDEKALQKVEKFVNDALDKGAQCLVGGKRSILGKTFFEPTVLSNISNSMYVAQQEIFGPIAPIFKFDTEQEVIQAANATEYGLAAYCFTENVARQWRLSEQLEYGMVGINTGLISNEVAPFGGVKASGLGREGSTYGIDEYLELKYICLDISE